MDQLGCDVAGSKLIHDRIQDGCLADADFAGNDDEAVVIQQGEPNTGDRPGVLGSHVDEFWVRGQVEGPALQVEEFLVHS